MNKTADNFLEHFGVVGMKWGVRRVRRNEALGRAARREGGLATKARAIGNLSRALPITAFDTLGVLVDNKKGNANLSGVAEKKFKRTKARLDRIHSGKAHLHDQIIRFGSTRLTDFVPVRASKANRVTTARDDKKIVAVHGALFIAKVLAKEAAKNAA